MTITRRVSPSQLREGDRVIGGVVLEVRPDADGGARVLLLDETLSVLWRDYGALQFIEVF